MPKINREEYEVLKEAQKSGFNSGNISLCCRGERKQHKGYIWEYTDFVKVEELEELVKSVL